MDNTRVGCRRVAGTAFLRGIIVVLVALASQVAMLTFSVESVATPHSDPASPVGASVSHTPTGDLLIALQPDGGMQQLFVIPAHGSESRLLVPDGTFDGDQKEGVWSPDGSQVAFIVEYDHSADLHVVNADGSDLRLLAPAPPHEPHPERVLTQGSPAWSPDGTKIAFASSRAWDQGGLDIYVIDSDGTNLQRLTDDPSFEESPRWSPGGSMIAFEVHGDGGDHYGNVFVMNADGSERRRLVEATGSGDPKWSPDGEWIAYADGRVCCAIHIVRPDGTQRRDLTGGGISGRWPRWSPDGRLLAWNSHDQGGSLDGLFVHDVRTGESRLISSTSGKPQWSPDGSWIAVAMPEIDVDGHHTGAGGLYLVRSIGGRPILLQKIDLDEYNAVLDWRADSTS